jgi:hypothetical protein
MQAALSPNAIRSGIFDLLRKTYLPSLEEQLQYARDIIKGAAESLPDFAFVYEPTVIDPPLIHHNCAHCGSGNWRSPTWSPLKMLRDENWSMMANPFLECASCRKIAIFRVLGFQFF